MALAPRALVATLMAATALALSATPALARTKSFQTPSHNIYCLYMSNQGPGPWIRCDVSGSGRGSRSGRGLRPDLKELYLDSATTCTVLSVVPTSPDTNNPLPVAEAAKT